MTGGRGEALFYHLTARPLERVLPELLEKSLERGWRAVLRIGAPARLEALNALLWTFRDDAFLPHGTAEDGRPERQPIYLTAGRETPNAPQILFLADGAPLEPGEAAAFERVAILFDGTDPEAVEAARAQWRMVVAEGARAVYWAQGEDGRWIRRSESG